MNSLRKQKLKKLESQSSLWLLWRPEPPEVDIVVDWGEVRGGPGECGEDVGVGEDGGGDCSRMCY